MNNTKFLYNLVILILIVSLVSLCIFKSREMFKSNNKNTNKDALHNDLILQRYFKPDKRIIYKCCLIILFRW